MAGRCPIRSAPIEGVGLSFAFFDVDCVDLGVPVVVTDEAGDADVEMIDLLSRRVVVLPDGRAVRFAGRSGDRVMTSTEPGLPAVLQRSGITATSTS